MYPPNEALIHHYYNIHTSFHRGMLIAEEQIVVPLVVLYHCSNVNEFHKSDWSTAETCLFISFSAVNRETWMKSRQQQLFKCLAHLFLVFQGFSYYAKGTMKEHLKSDFVEAIMSDKISFLFLHWIKNKNFYFKGVYVSSQTSGSRANNTYKINNRKKPWSVPNHVRH